eukprot:gene31272-6416_t
MPGVVAPPPESVQTSTAPKNGTPSEKAQIWPMSALSHLLDGNKAKQVALDETGAGSSKKLGNLFGADIVLEHVRLVTPPGFLIAALLGHCLYHLTYKKVQERGASKKLVHVALKVAESSIGDDSVQLKVSPSSNVRYSNPLFDFAEASNVAALDAAKAQTENAGEDEGSKSAAGDGVSLDASALADADSKKAGVPAVLAGLIHILSHATRFAKPSVLVGSLGFTWFLGARFAGSGTGASAQSTPGGQSGGKTWKEAAGKEKGLAEVQKSVQQRALAEKMAAEKAAHEKAALERAAKEYLEALAVLEEAKRQERAARDLIAREKAHRDEASRKLAAAESVMKKYEKKERAASIQAGKERAAREKASAELAAAVGMVYETPTAAAQTIGDEKVPAIKADDKLEGEEVVGGAASTMSSAAKSSSVEGESKGAGSSLAGEAKPPGIKPPEPPRISLGPPVAPPVVDKPLVAAQGQEAVAGTASTEPPSAEALSMSGLSAIERAARRLAGQKAASERAAEEERAAKAAAAQSAAPHNQIGRAAHRLARKLAKEAAALAKKAEKEGKKAHSSSSDSKAKEKLGTVCDSMLPLPPFFLTGAVLGTKAVQTFRPRAGAKEGAPGAAGESSLEAGEDADALPDSVTILAATEQGKGTADDTESMDRDLAGAITDSLSDFVAILAAAEQGKGAANDTESIGRDLEGAIADALSDSVAIIAAAEQGKGAANDTESMLRDLVGAIADVLSDSVAILAATEQGKGAADGAESMGGDLAGTSAAVPPRPRMTRMKWLWRRVGRPVLVISTLGLVQVASTRPMLMPEDKKETKDAAKEAADKALKESTKADPPVLDEKEAKRLARKKSDDEKEAKRVQRLEKAAEVKAGRLEKEAETKVARDEAVKLKKKYGSDIVQQKCGKSPVSGLMSQPASADMSSSASKLDTSDGLSAWPKAVASKLGLDACISQNGDPLMVRMLRQGLDKLLVQLPRLRRQPSS